MRQESQNRNPDVSGGLYIHVPFCRVVCPYCNFVVRRDDGRHDVFIAALVRSLREDPPGFHVRTIYIGGGTPSRLSRQNWIALFAGLRPWLGQVHEFTVEANPEDLSDELLTLWAEHGVTRLSVGVQRLDVPGLKVLGRAASREAVRRLPALLQRWQTLGGVASVDLIYGLEKDDPELIGGQVRDLLALPIEHLSAYALTVESGTPFARAEARGRAVTASADMAAACYQSVVSAVYSQGWEAYELSNFAMAGRHGLHNSNYWRGLPYAGYGPGAVSYGGSGDPTRRTRHSDYATYLGAPADDAELESLTEQQRTEEHIFLGLRSDVGVERRYWEQWQRIAPDIGRKLLADGIVRETADRLYLLAEHRFIADEVAARWIAAL